MSDIDYSIATSEQIEAALGRQVARIRLARNWTQARLAREAGVARVTISQMEAGRRGVSLNTFLRVLHALGLQGHIQTLLPDPTVRPMERIEMGGRERQRARPARTDKDASPWSWGDETADHP
jgi:transcriptional regulator with XRE-family HTH domain